MYWVELQKIKTDFKATHPTDDSNWNEIMNHMKLGIGSKEIHLWISKLWNICLVECNLVF